MNLGKFQELLRGREAWHAAVRGAAKSQIRLSDWTATTNRHTTFLLSSHVSDTQVVSIPWLLWLTLQWTWERTKISFCFLSEGNWELKLEPRTSLEQARSSPGQPGSAPFPSLGWPCRKWAVISLPSVTCHGQKGESTLRAWHGALDTVSCPHVLLVCLSSVNIVHFCSQWEQRSLLLSYHSFAA